MKKHFFLFLLFSSALTVFSQNGGQTVYNFLNLPFSARSAALGNDFISSKDEDLNLGVQNPSLYNAEMHNHFGFNQAVLAGGINYGMLTYARNLKEGITGALNFRYLNYGKMDLRDEGGVKLGDFRSGDFVLGGGLAKQLNPLISIGGNVNLIYSQLESFYSLGIAFDLAGTYEIKEKNLTMTALVKNAGYEFKPYIKKQRAPLPAEFQFAIGYKLKHAPFRFTLLLHHLNQFDLTFMDPNIKPRVDALTGDTIPVKYPGFTEKVFRHFTYQVELIFTKNFHIRTAFDYHLRQELKLVQKPGISGFSFGMGLKFKRFNIDYALVAYSASGYNNLLSLTTNFDKWRK